jgi:hypothetical protein
MPSLSQDDAFGDLEPESPIADILTQQMMFVSGETVEPSQETTMLVEQIVQQQVMEMVSLFNQWT